MSCDKRCFDKGDPEYGRAECGTCDGRDDGRRGMKKAPLDARTMRRMQEDGWDVYYIDSVYFVGATHPRGGKRSLVEIDPEGQLSLSERDRIGHLIVAALKEEKPELKDMATMIRRLASALRKADPISILPAEAIGFLKRTGHKPEPMRLGEAIRVAYEEEQEGDKA